MESAVSVRTAKTKRVLWNPGDYEIWWKEMLALGEARLPSKPALKAGDVERIRFLYENRTQPKSWWYQEKDRTEIYYLATDRGRIAKYFYNRVPGYKLEFSRGSLQILKRFE